MKNALGDVQTVLLLGGTSEIGLAIAEALVRGRGVRTVALAGRDPAALEAAGAPLRQLGAETPTLHFDAFEVERHPDVVTTAFEQHGDIDLVIAAWGVLGDQQEAELDPDAAVRVATVDYLAAVSTLLSVADRLEHQGHGGLVVMSSVAGLRGRRSNYVYGSAKAGLDVLAQGLGDRLAPQDIGVLVARPGFVHTRMTAGLDPAPLATTPEVVATAVVRGLDRGAHTVYAPGLVRWVMTVLRALPRAIFRRLPV